MCSMFNVRLPSSLLRRLLMLALPFFWLQLYLLARKKEEIFFVISRDNLITSKFCLFLPPPLSTSPLSFFLCAISALVDVVAFLAHMKWRKKNAISCMTFIEELLSNKFSENQMYSEKGIITDFNLQSLIFLIKSGKHTMWRWSIWSRKCSQETFKMWNRRRCDVDCEIKLTSRAENWNWIPWNIMAEPVRVIKQFTVETF